MSLTLKRRCVTLSGFPRPRGDEPGDCRDIMREMPVFPAHAGMSLSILETLWLLASFPRPRGDEPDEIGSPVLRS